jgi:hypothetical protein
MPTKSESSKAAEKSVELAKPLYPVRICQEEELPAVMVDAYYDSDIDAERERWKAAVTNADKSGYARGWKECEAWFKERGIAVFKERDKQPIALTDRQVQDILCFAINCPQDTKAATHKQQFEAVLNGN